MILEGEYEISWGGVNLGRCSAVIDLSPPPAFEDLVEERFQFFKKQFPYHKLWLFGEKKVRRWIRKELNERIYGRVKGDVS